MTIYTAQTYNDPSGLNSDPGDPVTSELMKAALFNPRAIAQASADADTMQQAMHLVGTISSAADSAGPFDFSSADISGYHEIRIIGGASVNYTVSTNFRIQLDYASSGWTTVATYPFSTGGSDINGIRVDFGLCNLDQAGPATDKMGYLRISDDGTDNWRSMSDTSVTATQHILATTAEAVEGARVWIDGNGGIFDGASTAPTRFALYGRKIV